MKPPGQISAQLNPELIMMICTAGHVDHGKTLLVNLLTGCQTDRLREEQERGLTIELGFAPCYLGNNLSVGIVDVPGHEKFIKTMVSGVSGIGMTVLVVAADDSVMPQTIEHVQIMELLGVRRGLIALTKIDLVSEQRIHQCTAEIRSQLKDTFLRDAPICPVSSKTFAGYQEFYDTLAATIQQVSKTETHGVFRMPVERVFKAAGHGAVVSGIPVDGKIELGAEVELVPGGQTGKIRRIQRFLHDAQEGRRGQCLALNIPDFGKTIPERGQVVCLPGYLKEARCFHVSLRAAPGLSKPLQNAEQLKFHTGTIEQPGKLYLLKSGELVAGQTGWATIVLEKPVPASVWDSFIIRRPSPPATVGGGEIRDVTFGDNRPRKAEALSYLNEHDQFFAGVDLFTPQGQQRQVEWRLGRQQKLGAASADISRATLLTPNVVKGCLDALVKSGIVLTLAEDYFVHAEAYRDCLAKVQERVKQAGKDAAALSLTLGELRQDSNWPAQLWNRIETDLERLNLIRRRGGRVVLSAAVEQLSAQDCAIRDKIVQVYDQTGFQSPRPDELPSLLNASAERIDRLARHLCDEMKLIRLSQNVVLSYSHFKNAQDLVVQTILQKGAVDSADFKHHLNSTRKYALAILDFLDARHVTVRSGNNRKLTMDYKKNLL